MIIMGAAEKNGYVPSILQYLIVRSFLVQSLCSSDAVYDVRDRAAERVFGYPWCASNMLFFIASVRDEVN
jgi:hypothetical protein